MDIQLLKDLLAHLESVMIGPSDCNSDFDYTIRFLISRGLSIEQRKHFIEEIWQNGVCCDCEIIFNQEDLTGGK